MKIDIIGAGPAGNYSAYLLAKKGFGVNVYEKDKIIGQPVQCTGILSDYFENIMLPDKRFVLNTVDKTRIYSPDGCFVEAKIKKNYVICRKRFDSYLAELAKKAGAKYFLAHSFRSFEKKGGRFYSKIAAEGKEKVSEADILIGADGPLSPVAKSAGLFGNREFIIGTQIEAYYKNDNAVEFYPYIGCYAWVVPVTKTCARIGVAAYKDSKRLFDTFAEKKIGKKIEKKIIENQSGIIPVFMPKIKAGKEGVYLTGDAAAFNKATSGGGINQALKAAEAISDCISSGKDYEIEWRKKMYRNLHMHLILHKMMRRFTYSDWNSLIRIFFDEKMKKILYSESRDNVVSMIIKIALANPRLFGYARYFPKEEIKNIF